AFGALPFVPGRPSELVVPALVVGRAEDGTRWVTTITEDDDPGAGTDAPARLEAADEPLPSPGTFSVAADLDPTEWCRLVEQAARATTGPDLAKVVLARQVTVTTDRPLDRSEVLARLRTAYPGCHLVSVDGLVAASPELLVSVAGDVVRSHPMAGTAPRGGDPAA